jgi:phosphoglycolate phosphatase
MDPSPAPVRGVVFDLDGTLIDSSQDIASAANEALALHGYAERDHRDIARFVGDGARRLMCRASELPLDDPRLDALVEGFVACYSAHPTDRTVLMPGARIALAELSGHPMAVCTNKPRSVTDLVLTSLGIGGFFGIVVGGGDFPSPKPHPEPVLAIARHFGVAASELVIVGDGPQDIECARAVGARAVGVRGPFAGDRLLEAGPDALIESLDRLPALLEEWGLAPLRR